jgi:GntR family transcriptional regulator
MHPEPTAGVVPVHLQIADSIRAQIAAGELRPGDPIPTVDELRRKWGCAPAVARSAVDVLRNEGLVSTGRGRRTVVRVQPRRIKLSTWWALKQKELVLRPESERAQMGAIEMTAGVAIADTHSAHHYSVTPASSELAQEFGIAVGADLVRREYEMVDKRTSHRISYSISYIPKFLIAPNPDLLDETQEPWPGGHQHQLYTVGIEIDRFVRSITAVEPTPGTRQKWGIEPGVPLLRIRSKSIDIKDRVVEISDATYPADRTEIEYIDQLERWPENYERYVRGE